MKVFLIASSVYNKEKASHMAAQYLIIDGRESFSAGTLSDRCYSGRIIHSHNAYI